VVVHITAETLVPGSISTERLPELSIKDHGASTEVCQRKLDVDCVTYMVVNILQFSLRKRRPRRRTPINRPQSTINHPLRSIAASCLHHTLLNHIQKYFQLPNFIASICNQLDLTVEAGRTHRTIPILPVASDAPGLELVHLCFHCRL